jgi:hypothetical protein
METQAQAPGQPQAQTPVHPIHEETATHNALTKWVSENPDNDPHAGTDMEQRREPTEAPAEAQAETPKEEVAEEVEKVEFDEETPIFDIEYKTDSGKESKKLSLKELREGWMAKQDYHRNIQKVKAQESELSTKQQQAELKAGQEYAQKLELHKQAVQRLAGVKTMPEIEALSRQDPAAAQQEFLRLISVNQTIQALEGEQRAVAEKHQQAMRASHAQAVEKAKERLEANIKGWGPELYTKVLGGVAKEYGFQNQEVEPVVDARLIEVFHDAYQYRQLQKAKPDIAKKVVAVPKVVKPGSAEKTSTSSAADEHAATLKKTGSGDAFVQWYLANQKQQQKKR